MILLPVFVLCSIAVNCLAENSTLPDPEKQPEYYANKWLVITATETEKEKCACERGVVLNTDNYGNLKDGLFVCVAGVDITQKKAQEFGAKLKQDNIDYYIKKSEIYKIKNNSNGEHEVVLNSTLESSFNDFVKFSRAKVVSKESKSKKVISGDYFGLKKSMKISFSDSIIDEENDTISKGDFECKFYCPPKYRNSIKNKDNLYCAVPLNQGRLLLIYFYKDRLESPQNDSTYYVIQKRSGSSYLLDTTYVQSSQAPISGTIRIHSLDGGYLLVERIDYRFTCPGELIQFTVFNKELQHVQTLDRMTTIPTSYLQEVRPVKREDIPEDEINGLNESMCYVTESFYSMNYNGIKAIVQYDDFKLTEINKWNETQFEVVKRR